ncbi:hypothetical protein OGAPHI_005529 [Ogataea philodendri]|uniref:Uncharacterized protein n=1 Tax=Ogataea philodendri TaxID=1378263 RepID=A0A9P8NYY0_9ASCO|nr:uncharacterized protein OGAPHI_005529 [Ogataea philodendri]KAH3662280.1 hypothetical protein OGAPHI_005529 [Ogataea philodendri]
MDISLSVQETNKLRAQLGLSLIPVPGENGGMASGARSETKPDKEYENFLEAEKKSKKEQTSHDLQDRITQTKSDLKRRQLESGETLISQLDKEDVADDDWLASLGAPKKRSTKKKAMVRTQEDTLEGVAVAHDKEEYGQFINENDETVFTLKDKGVLDDGEDELESSELNERLKVKRVLDAKSKKKDVEEEQVDGFRIGEVVPKPKQTKKPPVSLLLDLDDEAPVVSDYVAPVMKKLKKKVQNKRKNSNEDLKEADFKKVKLINEDLEKDDEIEMNNFLAASRRRRQEKKLVVAHEQPTVGDGQTVLDEDAEFLENLKPVAEDAVPEVEADSVPAQPKVDLESISAKLDVLHDKVDDNMGIGSALKLLRETPYEKSNTSQINLVYTDDDGKVLTTKEAYKYLSHKFHGHRK